MPAEFSVDENGKWTLEFFPPSGLSARLTRKRAAAEFIHELITHIFMGTILNPQPPGVLPSPAFPLQIELWERPALFYLRRDGHWIFEVERLDIGATRISHLVSALTDQFGGDVALNVENPHYDSPVVIKGLFTRTFEDDPLRALSFFGKDANPVHVYSDFQGDWIVRFIVHPEFRSRRFRDEDRGFHFRKFLIKYFQATLSEESEFGSLREPTPDSRVVFRVFGKTAFGYVDEDGSWIIRIPVTIGPKSIEDLVTLYGGSVVGR